MDLLAATPDEWLAATGGGVYRTRDAGATWTRLDTGQRPYARSVFVNDGRLYTAVNEARRGGRRPTQPSTSATPGATAFAGCNDGSVLAGPGFDSVGRIPVSD